MGDLADRSGEKMCGGVRMLARMGFRLLLLVKEIGSVGMKEGKSQISFLGNVWVTDETRGARTNRNKLSVK